MIDIKSPGGSHDSEAVTGVRVTYPRLDWNLTLSVTVPGLLLCYAPL